MFLNVNIEHDTIRRRSRLVCDLDVLEETEIFDAPLGAVDQGAVVRTPFGNIELAPDYVIAGAVISANIDPLDIRAGAFIDDVGKGDGSRLGLRSPRGRTVANG